MSGSRPKPTRSECVPVLVEPIELPPEVPVMTLHQTVLFPQAMMPLFIFEPRHKAMLSDALANHRIIAIASIDKSKTDALTQEPPHNIAGLGVIRACKQNPDGSSNIVLQGLARVEIESILSEEPYRTARIRARISKTGGNDDQLADIQANLVSLIRIQIRLGARIPREIITFLNSVNKPEDVLDLAISTLCPSADLKQELLETRDILPRYEKFQTYIHTEIERLKFEIKCKGKLKNDQIGNN